jgi:hypothetical protein
MSKTKLMYIAIGIALGVYVVPRLPFKLPGA